jgi:hypothetical protein
MDIDTPDREPLSHDWVTWALGVLDKQFAEIESLADLDYPAFTARVTANQFMTAKILRDVVAHLAKTETRDS